MERKFGQFAFPDAFNQAIKAFRDRVWNRHSKIESVPGKVYRSLVQIRFQANPDWDSEIRKIKFIVILDDKDNRETDRGTIKSELIQQINKIDWPAGYEWGTPRLLLGTAEELSAKEIINSEQGDFDYLCF